jgi:arabinogalactan oligomer/maltooligosaccharide transport system substrate-binding protein
MKTSAKMKTTIITLVLFIFIITGCGTPASQGNLGGDTSFGEAQSITLTIWHDKEDAVAEVLQTKLDQLAPAVMVNLEKKNGLTEALKMVGNDPNSAPDMFFFAHDKIGVYGEMGILSPITDFVDAEALEDYIPMTIEAATYKGVVYQLPIYFETLLFMYNRSIMSDDEVPETTEELYEFVRRNTSKTKYGFVEQHSTAYYSAGWIHGFGGELISPEGVSELNSPEVIEALTYHLQFVDYMPGETEYATVNTLFNEGMAAATIGGPWLVPTVRAAGIDLGLAPMPIVDATGLPISPYSGVQGLHVLRVAGEDPGKKDAIVQVLQSIMGTDIGVAMAGASGCAPALTACYDLEEIKGDDMVMMMRTTAESAIPMPNIPQMDVMWNVAGNLLVDVNMRGVNVTEAANAAQEQAEELIASMQ